MLRDALENIQGTLSEAIGHIENGETRETLSTLLYLDEHVKDMNAALHLFRRMLQNARRPA